MKPIDLKCEFMSDPIGIEEKRPRLSWRIEDDRPGAAQTAFQLVATGDESLLKSAPDLWDSGKVAGAGCLDIPYGGRSALASRQRVWWRVRSWDQDGKPGEWSDPAFFEMGLLKPADWQAKWIGRDLSARTDSVPCTYLRRAFTPKTGIRRARLYVTARGICEAYINGGKVGEDLFTPGWTDYAKRIRYMSYDVTDMMESGANSLAAIVADGWHSGYLTRKGRRALYGEQTSLLLQLEIRYNDDTSETICSDRSWRTATGPLLLADIYQGETYDARLEQPGWADAVFDDSQWQAAMVFDAPKAKLSGIVSLPVRRQEGMPVQVQTEPAYGVHVFDLGQNIVGWVRIKVRAQAGDAIRIRYAEMLNPDGTLYTANLRSARSTDVYICRGDGEEVYEPRFTFHGFRYVEMTNLREKPAPSDVTGIVVHSEIPLTGKFECSNPLVNRIQKNIEWGQKGNFLEVPTDCPQRDERLGWTGNAQVFCRTSAYNRDVSAFFTKWCQDLADSQLSDGGFPFVAPDVLRDRSSSTAWGDAGVICPWTMYVSYGDKRILERHYDSMAKWVAWHRKNSKNFVSTAWTFGDWLAIDMSENNPGRTPTPSDLVSTAYFARSADLMSRIAGVLGRKADEKRYAALFARVRTAFNREFVSPAGRIVGDTQTGYLLALGFNLLPPAKRAVAVRRLVGDIEKRGWRLSTGFVGTALLLPVLSRVGQTDVAYRLLLQEKYPSWIYSIQQGATTMWERWNSYSKDKGFGNVDMNSFNHYAYGAVGEWMYSVVAGIDLDETDPGYRHIIIKPRPGGEITWAKGELMTRYGRAACSWKKTDARLDLSVEIPPCTVATINLPGCKPRKVSSGKHEFSCALRSE